MVSYSQSNKFGKSIITRFWAVLCQPVHPNSNISHFRQFFLWCSALWIFIETRLQVRKGSFKIIVALSLGSLAVGRPYSVNLYLADVGTCPGNQCTQNQI